MSLIPSENDVVSHDINASEEIVRFDLSLAEVSRRDVQIASAADVSEIDSSANTESTRSFWRLCKAYLHHISFPDSVDRPRFLINLTE